MLEYLHANNFNATFSALQSDARTTYSPDPKAKYVGLLEKKWMSVIRLQKKVCAVVSGGVDGLSDLFYKDYGPREQKCSSSRRVIAGTCKAFCFTGRLATQGTSRTRPDRTSIESYTCSIPPTIFSLGFCKRGYDSQDMGLGDWRIRTNAQRAYQSRTRC